MQECNFQLNKNKIYINSALSYLASCCQNIIAGTAEGEGLVGLQPYHFFAWVDLLGLVITWIMYDNWLNGDPDAWWSWPNFISPTILK